MKGRWVPPVLYSNHAQALHAYVRASMAILFASYISVSGRLQSSGLVARPLDSPEMHARVVQVQVMQGRQLPAVMEAFIDTVIQRINQINAAAPQS